MRVLQTITLGASLLVALSASATAHCVKSYLWMFTQPGCEFCEQARELFARNGIQLMQTQEWQGPEPAYFAKELSIVDTRSRFWNVGGQSFSGTNAAYLRWRFGFFGTPAIEIDGTKVIGYNEPLLRQLTCSQN